MIKEDNKEETETKMNEDLEKDKQENDNPKLFILKTTAGKEEQVMDYFTGVVKRKNLNIYSVIHPNGMKGYLIIEAKSYEDASNAVQGIPYAKGILPQQVSYDEISHMIETEKKQEISLKVGDFVEIISGPFQKEQAKVIRFDLNKEDVVVELVNAAVPIPITLKIDNIRVIRRD